MIPRHRIDGPVTPVVAIVVGNEAGPAVSVNGPVKVVKDKESREPETGGPEGVRDPRVHVGVIPGRRVIRDDGRSFAVVVVVYYIGI